MKKLMQTLCLALFAGILAACGGDSPDKTAKTFFSEMIDGDVNKAAELVYLPPETVKRISQKDMNEEAAKSKLSMMIIAARDKMKKEGGVLKAEIGEVSYTNAEKTEAKIAVILKTQKDGQESARKQDFVLIKTDKGWKIKL